MIQALGFKITALTYAWTKQAIVFVPSKPFQPSVMFVGNARSLSQTTRHPLGYSTFQYEEKSFVKTVPGGGGGQSYKKL